MSGKVQLTSLLSKLDQPRSMIPMIARANGPQLGRFEVIHVVRPQRHQPVTHLVRGNVLLPPQGLDAATLDAMAHRLAAHLRRRQRQDGSMTGRFLPTRDQYVETKASSIEQALTIYALARWLGYLEPDSITTTQRLATQSAIGRAAQHLAGELIIPLGEQDTAACALTLMALIDCPSLVDRKALRNALLRRILARQNQDGSFQSGNEQNAPPLPAKYRALPLLALAKLYKKTHDKALLDPIRRASKWLDGPGKSRDMVMLTWLNQANNLLRKSGEPGERDLAGDDQLMREAIDVLLKKQVRQTSELAGADVVGGFDFAGTGLQPGPDWTTGYGILFLATTLNRDRGGDEVRVILSAALAARFVAQLMFDEPGCYYVPSPEDVLGAVRKSLADNEVSAAPSAVALLAVMELQNAMAQWQKRAAVPKQ